MGLVFLAVDFEAADPPALARFWAELLGRHLDGAGDHLLLPGSDTQVGLRFTPGPAENLGTNLVHLHITSTTEADRDATVAQALRLGARHLDVGQRPEETHVVLGDPEGNEFCVIAPGNRFLAGCGRLGELACDGSRTVGLFWSDALGWPLVWDQDEETAIQSLSGGTKIAWGGPPLALRRGGRRQEFVLAADGDLDAAVDRLIALGAAVVDRADSHARLTDPDGNVFTVLR